MRYTGYCLIALDVAPAPGRKPAQMAASALTEDGTAVDRFTVRRG